MSRRIRDFAPLALGLVSLVFLLLHGNPFANVPDVVLDENYFVTGALSTIAHHTIPGLDFVAGGPYYGAVTAHLTTLLIGLVLAWQRLALGSFGATETWAALHVGDLDHVVRLANAIVVLAAALYLGWRVWRERTSDTQGRVIAATLLGLLLADSLVVTIMPTGKVWVVAMTLELAMAWLVARQERLLHVGHDAMPASRYATMLVWIGFVAFLQNLTGVLTCLWIAYAVALGHLRLREVWRAAWRAAPVWIFLLAANASMFKRFHDVMIAPSGLSDATKTSFLTTSGAFDVFKQLTWPIGIAFTSAALAVIVVVACFARDLAHRRLGWERSRRWATLLYAHLPVTLVGYHLVFGFGHWPRYVLPLTVACCLVAAFLPKSERAVRGLAYVALVAGLVVSAKAAWLWHTPSAEAGVVAFFRAHATPQDVIVVDNRLLKLPPNAASLARLNPQNRAAKRVDLLLAHPETLAALEPFRALVLYESTSASPADGGRVWTVTSGCTNACRADEGSACQAFVSVPCDKKLAYPQEGEVLRGLFDAERLGGRYFVR